MDRWGGEGRGGAVRGKKVDEGEEGETEQGEVREMMGELTARGVWHTNTFPPLYIVVLQTFTCHDETN